MGGIPGQTPATEGSATGDAHRSSGAADSGLTELGTQPGGYLADPPGTPDTTDHGDPPGEGNDAHGDADDETSASSLLPETPDHTHDFGCGKTLEAWGVTRQFSFGQFVILYARDDKDIGRAESVPLVVTPEGTLNREVRTTKSEHLQGAAGAQNKAVMVSAADMVARANGANKAGKPPVGSIAEEVGGLPLDLALSADDPMALVTQPPPSAVKIDNLRDVLENKAVVTDTGQLRPILDDAAKVALLEGRAVDALAEYDAADPAGGAQVRRTMVRLNPITQEIVLDAAGVDTALATGAVRLPGNAEDLILDRTTRVDNALRSGSAVTLTASLSDGTLRRYRVSASPLPTSEPLAKTFTIEDPSAFLRTPYLPAVDGTPLRVKLDDAIVTKLRTARSASFDVNGTQVTLLVVAVPDQAASSKVAPTAVAFMPGVGSGAVGLVAPLSGVSPGLPLPGGPAVPGGPGAPWPGFPLPNPNLPPPAGPGGPGTGIPVPSGPLPGPAGGIGGAGPIGLTPDPDGGFAPVIDWPGKIAQLDKVTLLLANYPFWAKQAQIFDGSTKAPPGSEPSGEAIPGPVKGLPVALFLPWKQEWRFTGLSRGNLLSSIALAPREERVIRTYSWERRSKALEQSTETETEMQQDYTSTTRDTDDVLREMTSNQKFNSQFGADFEASYSPGIASIKVGANLDLSQELGLQQVTKSSTQHLTETVHRASARVRSRRITKITESSESVTGEDVVRRIVNHNDCRTMTLDYFEQLAHYTITTKFEKERLRVVVMIDNPLRTTPFTNLTLRTNETALRQSLLNPELGDGFTAARLLASYENAWLEAARVAAESKKVAELDKERAKDATATPPVTKPENPYKDQVLKAAKDVRDAAKKLQGTTIDAALIMIGAHMKPLPYMITAGQYWLWFTLAAAKLGAGVTDALNTIAAVTADPSLDDARRLNDAFGAGRVQELSRLASLPDNEKEDLALAGAIHRFQAAPWDWAWWSGSCRDNGLYTPNDGGLVGAMTRMTDALGKYEAKESEGDALLQGQQMVQKANEEQAAANWVDKLEMKYGLDVVADAQERQTALLTHLEDHKDYYHYVLFQALPPGEQLKLLTANAAELRVGFFEPRVVAYNGDQLAIPLTPTGQNELAKFVKDAQESLAKAAKEAQEAADKMVPEEVIIPTAGLVVETSMGKCSACEPHREQMHALEARSATALARQAGAEADRRDKLLAATPPKLGEFTGADGGGRLTVRLEHAGPPT
ncbi:hypothetical protein [Kribbella sp. C-35]|uniref:hypothetical protein n=1 Tax=Kribbella sp. C-35 TaxID=2789276 RepID=UPI00397A6011